MRARLDKHLQLVARLFDEALWVYSATDGEENVELDADALLANVVTKANSGIDLSLLMNAVGKLGDGTKVHIATPRVGEAVGDLDLLNKVDSSL